MIPSSSHQRPLRSHSLFWGGLMLFGMIAYCLVNQYDGLFGQDCYGYLNDANALIVWMKGGENPPDFFWTRAYSGLGAVIGFPFGNAHIPLLAISMLSGAGILMMSILWTQERFPDFGNPGPFLMLSLGLSPFLFRNGVSLQSDLFAIFWAVLVAWQADRYGKTGSLKAFLLAVFGVGCAVAVRYAMIPLVFLPCVYLFLQILKHKHFTWIFLLPLALLPFLPDWFLFPDPPSSLSHGNVNAWSPLNFFRSTFQNLDGNTHYPYPNIVYLLKPLWNPGLLGLGIFAWIMLIIKLRGTFSWNRMIVLLPILPYALLIGGIPFQNDRFLLPMIPFLAVYLWPSVHFFLRMLTSKINFTKFQYPLIISLFALGSLLVVIGGRSQVKFNRMEREIASHLQEKHPEKRIYTLGMEPMLEYRAPKMTIISMYTDSMPMPNVDDLILSEMAVKYPQWQDLPAGKNWQKIQSSFSMDTLVVFSPTWALYGLH